MKLSSQLAAGADVLTSASAIALAADWYPYKIEVWDSFDMASARHSMDYTPVEKAAAKHKICVSFPHMKDDYWLAVDYGVIAEAKRTGVAMQVLEAGGYTELNKQISQIENCVAGGAQAVIIGAISFDGLNNLVGQLADKKIPVIDVINGISSPEVSAKSLVSFYTMGHSAGEYLAKKHPAAKRFGLEGGETTIVGIHSILKHGSDLGVDVAVFGMAHRGRFVLLEPALSDTRDDS